jgi:hypothetical protein
MAKKMLIVHGYSDGSVSFFSLRDFFVRKGLYKREDVYLLDYASMDDDATFRDFADKRVREGRKAAWLSQESRRSCRDSMKMSSF